MTAVGMMLSMVGCAIVPPEMNEPQAMKVISEPPGSPLAGADDDQTLLLVTFSGGGTRAAALSYGVLKGLRDTVVGESTQPRSLLSEVDVISSVSGGSFTAAYYGLFGDKLFSDFEQKFLYHPVQSDLITSSLLPSNWAKLGSELFNRSDLAAEYYDSHVFAGKTFADMRPDAPLIIINATDISAGLPFAFTMRDMAMICSDLDTYPVSRAVAASSAVPGVFSPITLKNHSGCANGVSKRGVLRVPLVKPYYYRVVQRYRNKHKYPYLHLIDGGITDNLGVRSLMEMAQEDRGSFVNLLSRYGLGAVKNVGVIVVNAADDIPPGIAQNAEEPTLEDMLGAVTTLQSRRYNEDTMRMLRQRLTGWQEELSSSSCRYANGSRCRPISFHLVELNLQQLPEKLAREVRLYKTSFELPRQQVETLVHAGQYLLKRSQSFQNLVRELR